jgi:hypothetical protein
LLFENSSLDNIMLAMSPASASQRPDFLSHIHAYERQGFGGQPSRLSVRTKGWDEEDEGTEKRRSHMCLIQVRGSCTHLYSAVWESRGVQPTSDSAQPLSRKNGTKRLN